MGERDACRGRFTLHYAELRHGQVWGVSPPVLIMRRALTPPAKAEP